MGPYYLFFALLIQCSLSYADVQSQKNETESFEILLSAEEIESSLNDVPEDIKLDDDCEASNTDNENMSPKSDSDDVLIKDFRTATNDWVDTVLGSSSSSYPSSAIMAQAANSNKSPEEQLEEIKEVASEITMAIQSEMANLLSYALNYVDKDSEDSKRRKRSIETPMDSSQLVMRLLNHIKSNNEYQNIAIEKMMSAQEIADKFGVEFNPDPEILSDLAFAANEQAKELTSILQDACSGKNSSCVIETTNIGDEINLLKNAPVNTTFYVYSENNSDNDAQSTPNTTSNDHEHIWQPVNVVQTNNHHHHSNNPGYNYYSYPQETQIPSPPAQYSHGASVTPKPTFYDSISYNPNEYYLPYCSMDQMAYPYLFDEPVFEQELVGEEFEETLTSRVIIEQDDEPGSATVNHITTYTMSEKSHFKSPQIEKLPQQMQYYFFLL